VIFDVPADRAWAAAFAAQRINGRYIKQDELVTVRRGDSDEPVPCNKELTMRILSAGSTQVTQEDLSNAELAREWFQGQLFALLGDQLNDFMKKAAETAVKDIINLRQDMGILACLPQTWLRASQKEQVEEVLNEADSQFVGSITEKLVRMIHVLESKPGQTFTGWLVTATEGSNIFRFCSSIEFHAGEQVRIQGKVKRHEHDRKTNKPVTWLNYVKRLDS
jgi:hypothetical protein